MADASGPRLHDTRDATEYDCRRCGSFIVTRSAIPSIEAKLSKEPKLRAITSHAIRRMQRVGGKAPELDSYNVEAIWQGGLPTPEAQANALVQLIGESQPSANEWAVFEVAGAGAIIGTSDVGPTSPTGGFTYVMDELKKRNLIERGPQPSGSGSQISFRLTFDGWRLYEQLAKAVTESRTAFMAMKFGEVPTDTLFRECFKPAVVQTGFELRRLDENPKAGLIDLRMEVLIRTAKFLISDLTHGNQGAYWEAGFATGLGKPVFYTCEKGQFRRVSTHFDTNHHYTILWEADKPNEAAEELKAAIRATLPADAKLADT